MNKEFLIELTDKLYKLTVLFPKKEPLRYKMREVADDIVANFCKEQNPEIFKNLEVLDSFFEVAKAQNWLSSQDILNLQQEYSKLKEGLKEKKVETRSLPTPTLDVKGGVNGRQEKILEILREKGKAQVWQLKQIFPEVSKRTLRRDFEFLLKQGKIERIGERNATFYQIKG